MKIKNLITILFLAGLMPLVSCLKQIEEGQQSQTIVIGHEEIPDINEFMPKELIDALGDNINDGIVPSWLEGNYTLDSTYKDIVLGVYDQKIASAKFQFTYQGKSSSSDATRKYFSNKANVEAFLQANSNAPYFQGKKPEDIDSVALSRIYIIGNKGTDGKQRFTAYYYEAQRKENDILINAVILSGIGPYSHGVASQVVQVTDTIPRDTLQLPIGSMPTIGNDYVYDSLVQNDSVYYFLSQIVTHDTTIYNTDSLAPMKITIDKWGVKTLNADDLSDPTPWFINIKELFRIPEATDDKQKFSGR